MNATHATVMGNITITVPCMSPAECAEHAHLVNCPHETDSSTGEWTCNLPGYVCDHQEPAEKATAKPARFKVVTRTYFEGTEFDDKGNTRDTRYLTRSELAEYLRAIQRDASDYGVSGTVNLDGTPYASFARGTYSPIPRCPMCAVRHLSPCVSRPSPKECPLHDHSIVVSLPNRLMGAVHSWSQYLECRHCGDRIPA